MSRPLLADQKRADDSWSANAAEGVRKTLFDESGEVLSLSRSRWGEADW